MKDKDVKKILKKYKIQENKSLSEIIELLEIKCDDLLERQNAKRDTKLEEEIDRINEVIEYLKTTEEDRTKYLTEKTQNATEDAEPDRTNEIERLRGTSDEESKSKAFDTSAAGNQSVASAAPSAGSQGNAGKLWFVSLTGDTTINNMFVQIEDNLNYEQWNMADRIAESILLVEPKNPSAFLAKALAKYKHKKVQELAMDTTSSLDRDVNIRKAHDFGNAAQAKYIDDLLEERHYFGIYKDAYRYVNSKDVNELRAAADKFDTISDYRDAASQADSCRQRADECERAEKESRRLAEVKKRVDDYLTTFEKKGGADSKGKEEVLKDLKAYLQSEPGARQFATDDVLLSLEDKIAASHELRKKIEKEKRGEHYGNIAAGILLVITVLFGIIGVAPSDEQTFEWKKSGILGFLPGTATVTTYTVENSSSSYFIHLGSLKELTVSNCKNLKYYILPDANLEKFTLTSEAEDIQLLSAEEYDLTIPNCNSLEIPEGAKTVYLRDASYLEKLVLPDSVENFYVSGTMYSDRFTIPDGIKNVVVSGKRMSEYAMRNYAWGDFWENIINDSDISVYGNDSVKQLTLPDSVEDVEIFGCSSLTELTIPEGVKNIKIWGATDLEELVLPQSIESIDIIWCGSLDHLTVPEGAKHVNVQWTPLEELTLTGGPEELTVINCSSLQQLSLPEGTKYAEIRKNKSLEKLIAPEDTSLYVEECPLPLEQEGE